MNPAVLRRFIVYLAALTAAITVLWLLYEQFVNVPPGDYYVRKGDIHLSDGKYGPALEHFDKALDEMPDHRGALMGRALVFMQTDRLPEAVAELDYLIGYLERTLDPDDLTGRGTLAAAYSNRGILHDRLGDYEKALEDYVAALNTDSETVAGPGVVHKILYGADDVSSVRKRAQYIYEQLQLPEGQRLMRIPEIDVQQRMHKP